MPLSLVSNASLSAFGAVEPLVQGLVAVARQEASDLFALAERTLPSLFAGALGMPEDLIGVERRTAARRLSSSTSSAEIDLRFTAVPPVVSSRELQSELTLLDDIAIATIFEDVPGVAATRNGQALEQRMVNHTVTLEVEVPCRAGYWVCERPPCHCASSWPCLFSLKPCAAHP